MRRAFRMAAGVVLSLSLAAGPVLAQASGKGGRGAARGEPARGSSAYRSLDIGALAGALRQMHMDELLDELVRGSGESSAARLLQVESMISRASDIEDIEERDKMLAGAAQILRELIDAAKPSKPREVCDYFELRFRLARTMALDRGEMYALRLLYLQGGPEDVRILRSLTEEAAKILDLLMRDVEEVLMDWRTQPELLVTLVPVLEDFQLKLKYWSAWVFAYQGMTLPDGENKKRLLGKAIFNAESFADGPAETGVKFSARLLMGIASRELNQFDQAEKHLKMLVGSERVPDGVKIQAMFEMARTQIERGRFLSRGGKAEPPAKGKGAPPAPGGAEAAFREAEKAVDRFEKDGKGMFTDDRGEIQVDVMAAMLRNYLHETWADCVSGPSKAANLQAAQEALLKFINKYADRAEVLTPFLDILAEKYRDRKDYDNLSAMILLPKAARAQANGKLEEAEKLLDMILARDDALSSKVRPMALWRKALILNDRKDNLKSAEMFLELAQKYPDQDLAEQAARNAVIVFNGIVQQRAREGKPVGANISERYVQALDVLLGNKKWFKSGDTPKWNFDRGWQCRQLAEVAETGRKIEQWRKWAEKGVESFKAVPRDQPEYPYARYLELEFRLKLIQTVKMDDEVRRTQAGVLLSDLKSSSEACRDAAGKLQGGTQNRRAQDLMNWGAQEEMWMAEVQYKVLAQEGEALSILSQLAGKWPGTRVLQQAAELEIRWLVERGQIERAIAKVDEFSKKYSKEEADQLVQLVVIQIQKRIGELTLTPGGSNELRKYRDVYLRFAQVLYVAVKDQPLDKRYARTQMYADALAENDQAAESLELFGQLEQLNQSRRQKEQKRIDDEYAAKLAELKGIAQDTQKVLKMAGETLDLMTSYGYTAENSSLVQGLAEAVAYVNNQDAKEPEAERLALLADRLVKAFGKEEIPDKLKRALPVDATNTQGQARCYWKLKRYDEALAKYRDMIGAIDVTKYAKLYWKTELDYCRCAMETYQSSTSMLGELRVRIRQNRLKDQSFGGFYEEFAQVEAEVSRILDKTPASAPSGS